VSLVELGDGLAGLRSLPAASVALVLSDLPSGETRAEHDRPPDFAVLWPAIWHALRPDGVAVLMASNLRFAARLLESQPRRFRYDLVWNKSIAVGFLNARHRPLKAHEHVLVFSRAVGTYHPQRTNGHGPIHTNGGRGALGSANYGIGQAVDAEGRPLGVSRAGATDRYPRSVLAFGSLGIRDRRRRHPQQKPVDLLRWCVRTYSDAGDLVADPYAGSGSTGEAARAEGRGFRGWDVNPRYGAVVDPLS
jgi:site-specific DNA-methyltransferase (adenine-specific)